MQHLEPLNTDELAFIIRRYRTESKLYMSTMNMLMVLGAIAPFIVCVVVAIVNSDELSSKVYYNIYFVGLIFMMLFVGLIAYVAYRAKLLAYHRDRVQRKKVVEITFVRQKKYMKLNNTYHFYLASPNKYTIEVSEQDFEKWQLGDEIKIEYAKHSKEYFGYF